MVVGFPGCNRSLGTEIGRRKEGKKEGRKMNTGFDSFGEGSFWQQDPSLFGGTSTMDFILEKDGFALEDILDEDSAIQETKGENEKLISFLAKPENLSRLISYISCTDVETYEELSSTPIRQSVSAKSTIDKEEEDQAASEAENAASLVVDDADESEDLHREDLLEERMTKFPFVACEILCCNLTALIEPLVKSPELLEQYFSILDQPGPLDTRLSGYFFKVLSVLLRRAPEKMLWFSVYKNLNISEQGCKAGSIGGVGVGWLMPLLLRHIDSYSIMCCFKLMLQAASDGVGEEQDDEENDDHDDYMGYGDGDHLGGVQVGDLDGKDEDGLSEEERNKLLEPVQAIWLGGSGAAKAILMALADSNNSDSHNNAAELLADMIQRAAMARVLHQEGAQESREKLQQQHHPKEEGDGGEATQEGNKTDVLPTFRGFVLHDAGQGPGAAAAMIESGCEWMLSLVENLLSVALFDSAQPAVSSTDKTSGPEVFVSTVERGSAAVAALQVLIHLVSSFALERWTNPERLCAPEEHEGVLAMCVTSMEKHEQLPPELDMIIKRLPDFVRCLDDSTNATMFLVDKEAHSKQVLGMHRLKIVELICMLVHTRYPEALGAIAAAETCPLDKCLELFFQFEWNNCLHVVIERALQFCLLGGVSEDSIGFSMEGMQGHDGQNEHNFHTLGQPQDMKEDGNDADSVRADEKIRMHQDEIAFEQKAANLALLPLQRCLFEHCLLVSRLLKAYEENTQCMIETEEFGKLVEAKSENLIRPDLRTSGQKGYMGHCHRIVNTIALVAASQRNKLLQDRFQKSQDGGKEQQIEDVELALTQEERKQYPALAVTNGNSAWVDLLVGDIANINSVEQCVLGGVRPRHDSIAASEDMDGEMGREIEEFQRENLKNNLDAFMKQQQMAAIGEDDDDNDEDDDDKAFDDIAAASSHDGDGEGDVDDEFSMLSAQSAALSYDDDLAQATQYKLTLNDSAPAPEPPMSASGTTDVDEDWDPGFAE